MFSYLLFFCGKTYAKLMAHMAQLENFLLQICFCFDFLVYSLIHRTKNLLCSNNWLRCHYSQLYNIFLEKNRLWTQN